MSVAMRDAFGARLTELGAERSDLVVLDADVSSSTKSGLFGKSFPDRFFNCGVAEANMVDVAAGFATCGYHPVVNAFAIFLALKSTDQIRNVLCYNTLPVVIAGAYGGLSDSFDGASHQSITDLAIMRAMPNMQVIVPADAAQAQQALDYALNQHQPVYIRLNRNALPDLPPVADFPEKRLQMLRPGRDITLAAQGITVAMALEAAELLAAEGIQAEVIASPFLKPFDEEGLCASVRRTGRLVTIEEHSIIGGLASTCSEALIHHDISCSFAAIGIQDRFTETGPYDELLAAYGLSAAAIAARARRVCRGEEGGEA